MLGVALAGLGLAEGMRLPLALYPELTYPRVVVVAALPGQPADTFDATVTRPLQAEIAAVPGVVRVRGHTIRGAAQLSINFDPTADVEIGFQRINAQVAALVPSLPPGVSLTSERITAASLPVVNLSLLGGGDGAALRDFALYQLRPRLAQLAGVGRVTVTGGDERELAVAAAADRLAEVQLSLSDLALRLREALPLVAAGRRATGGRDQAVVVRGLLGGPAALAALTVTGSGGSSARLGDVAEVALGHADRSVLVNAQGEPAVSVSIGRRYGADAVELSREVGRLVEALGPELPPGARLLTAYDQADLIAPAVAGVRDAIVIGALLAVAVIGLFLRNLRATWIGASALPLTFAVTLLVLAAAGQSLNLMSLGGLAVAIGLLIDDAVVVLEAIEHQLGLGHAVDAAVQRGVSEVRAAVLTSTVTTVVVLLPLVRLSGVVGQFFRTLAFALGAAVLLSLATALLAIPLLARFLRQRPTRASWAATQYGRSLSWTLRRPWLALVLAALLLTGGLFSTTKIATGFLPAMDEGAYVIDFAAPPGSSLAASRALIAPIERLLAASPFVRAYASRLGSEIGPPTVTQPNRGDFTIRLTPEHPPFEVLAEAQRRALAVAAPQVHVEFSQIMEDNLADLDGHAQPLEVKLFGPDPEALRAAAQAVGARLEKSPEVVDLFDGDPGCAPELSVELDPFAAGSAGLSAQALADQLRVGLFGEVVGTQPFADRTVPVRLRLRDGDRFAADLGERLPIALLSGGTAPLSALAKLLARCPAASVESENLRRTIAVTARLRTGNLGAVVREVKAAMAGISLPAGVTWELGGQVLSQGSAFGELLTAFALAALGLFVVLVIHFGSIALAVTQLAALPVALACGALSLWVAGVPLNVSSGLGFLVLAGLVVKNGVLLLDQAERRRRAGSPVELALREAAAERLRPILMTTLATLLGLLPLALGLGAGTDVQRPLAVVVLGGLGLSSLVTLYALPALYLSWHRRAVVDLPSPATG